MNTTPPVELRSRADLYLLAIRISELVNYCDPEDLKIAVEDLQELQKNALEAAAAKISFPLCKEGTCSHDGCYHARQILSLIPQRKESEG